jgi:hypothetical protein
VAQPTTSRSDTHPAPARPGDRGMPEVLRLLAGEGCVLCRTRDQAAATWVRWFVIESHSDPATLVPLLDSDGFCPAHTRRLLGLDSPQVLAMPWEFVLRGALPRAERLAAGSGPGRAAAPCPLCRTCRDREAVAADDLVAHLAQPQVTAVLRDRGGLCYRHLRELLPRMRPPQAAMAAEAVAARLSTLPPESPEACLALAGFDRDAPARGPLLGTHAARLAGLADPVGLPPRDRLTADLQAGSCPVCRAAFREETRYLLWLHERWPKGGPASLETHLCPRHLYDMWATGDSAPWLTGIRASSASRLAAGLAAAGADPAAAPRSRWPLARRGQRGADHPHGDAGNTGPPAASRAQPGELHRATPAEAYASAYGAVHGDDYCRACRLGQGAAQRQRDLVRASLHDARVLAAIGDAHGICLRHAADADADPGWRPLLVRLLTQLRQAQWELSEASEKGAWDHRHEPAGSEQTAWRRIPALIDGAVYLGLAEPEATVSV